MAGIVAICGLAACTASPPPAPDLLDTSTIELEDYASVTARLDYETGQVVLPVAAIDHLGPELLQARRDALHLLVDSCLADLGQAGYAWPEPPLERMDFRLYGSWSISFASRYGFSDSSAGDGAAPPELTADQKVCFGEADEVIRPVLDGIDVMDIDQLISQTSYDAVRASPEGKAALTSARDCMTGEGLALDPSSGYPPPHDSAPGSEANIRIAVIVATCNVETGAIQTLFDLTARYQSALMDQNEAAVTTLQQKNAERLAALKAIVESAD